MWWERVFRPRAAGQPEVPTVAATHPSSYADEIELALIATVLGAPDGAGPDGAGPDGAGPGGDPLRVRVVVDRWHRHRGCRPADSLPHISGLDDHAFARVLVDGSTLGGRPRSCVVQDAADALVRIGVEHAADLRADPAAARTALAGVRGLGAAEVDALCVLLGTQAPRAGRLRLAQPSPRGGSTGE